MKRLFNTLKNHFKREKQPSSSPFKAEWIPLLEKNFIIYTRLPEELKERLHDAVAQFISSKTFTGCNEFEVTEEVIVLISANACLLTLNLEQVPYPKLHSILIYPSSFKSVQKNRGVDGVITEEVVHRLGESWETGSVILAWDSVLGGARNTADGHNVALHEFAHQLDQEDGSGDGAPLMDLSRNQLHTWSHVMSQSYQRFLKIAEKKGRTVINRYGATNPAEFFAVTTETFFEKPKQLHKKWPALYDLFKDFYKVDPLTWKPSSKE